MTKLDELIQCITSKHVYIQTHNFPDPDAISSGFGLQYLLRQKGIESTICYAGQVDRVSTKNMIQLFNIEIKNIKDLDKHHKTSEIILVDTQYVPGNVDLFDGMVIGCVDHHTVFDRISYIFDDIRENTGSCASIVTSYFYDNNILMPRDVAEVLLYGIKTDTANLTRGVSRLDLDMFYELYILAEKTNINYLESNTIQVDDLKTYAEAIGSLQIVDNVCFAYTGENCSKSLIAVISDFALKIAGVNFSVVYSIRDEGVRLSVRSAVKELHSAEIIIETLDKIGTGGGHHSMAGGFVPIDKEKGITKENAINIIVYRILEIIRSIEENMKKNKLPIGIEPITDHYE